MTNDDFKVWAMHHATLFMMTSDTDQALFAAWKPLVLPYDLRDFLDGSNHLAQQKTSVFRTSHLGVICERINGQRMAVASRLINEENAQGPRYECGVCRGVGIVSVPHLVCVREGKWWPPYRTMGIYCLCARGRIKFDSVLAIIGESRRDRKHTPPTPLMFEKYEVLVPNWLLLMDEREALRREEIKARQIAAHADRSAPLRGALDFVLEKASERGDLQ
jgi:hypothetical protein